MNTIRFDAVKESETKRYVKYSEVATSHTVGTFYLSKESLNGKEAPRVITITVAGKKEQ